MARDVRPAQEYRPAPISLAQRAALRSQAPRALRRPARRRLYPLIALGVLLAGLVVALGLFEYSYRERIYPNVYVRPANIDVGGQTRGEAMASLRRYALDRRFRKVTLLAPASSRAPISVPAYALGYSFDRGLTAFHAIRAGRDGNPLRRAAFQIGLLAHSADVSAVQRVNRRALRDELFKLSGLTDRRPAPGVAGYQLDVAGAQRLIARRLLDADTGTVRLPGAVIPALPKPKPQPRPVHHGKPPAHKKGR